jgi:hypothetical protein
MGDISEMRGLIVVFTVIAVSITLINFIPSQFYTGETNDDVSTQKIKPSDVVSWNSTYILNMTSDEYYSDLGIAGWHVNVEKTLASRGYQAIGIETFDAWWFFHWNFAVFSWYKDGVIVSKWSPAGGFYGIFIAQLDSDYATGKGLNYVIKNDAGCQWDIALSFNTTLYDSPSEAWDDMLLIFKLDFADRNTSINALNLISMLFTAQLPNVDPIVCLLIAFPLWACIGYMCFIFVLRIVGAVFGGGGA